jgi:DeoR/GlpR family transcriptional regulator of sugar metabolism
MLMMRDVASIIEGVTADVSPRPGRAPGERADLPPEVRRDEITAHINAERRARVEEMAALFDVSPMTIHRDLDTLAKEGRVERIRGGARAITERLAERDVRLRRHLNAGIKERLARVAATLIDEGAVIALDDSTTIGTLGPHLAERRPATVITHSLPLINTVAQLAQTSLVGLGGQYYPETDSFLGSVVVEQARHLMADAVFISTTAIRGQALLHPDAEAAATKRAVLGMGSSKILVVDSSKFGNTGLYNVATFAEIDDVVIDANADEAAIAELRELGVEVHIA